MSKPNGCPKCGNKKYWKIRRNKRKCTLCRHEYLQKRSAHILSAKQWQAVIKLFILEQSIASIVEQTGISRYKVMKALDLIRERMLADLSALVEGRFNPGGTERDDGKEAADRSLTADLAQGQIAIKEPIFGILCYRDKIWATRIRNRDEEALFTLIQKVNKGAVLFTDASKCNLGVENGASGTLGNEDVISNGNFNQLKGFWGYLKRKLVSKGGIRKERFHAYLAEYAWRYNNRNLDIIQKVEATTGLIFHKRH